MRLVPLRGAQQDPRIKYHGFHGPLPGEEFKPLPIPPPSKPIDYISLDAAQNDPKIKYRALSVLGSRRPGRG